MKIYIDCYGLVAYSLTRQLIEKFNITIENLLINTYSSVENIPYKTFLEKNKIKHSISSYDDNFIQNAIQEFSPDIIFSFYSRRIIPQTILQLAKKIAVNLHPSLLPKYRGCFSCPWAIINNEEFVGISFHTMEEKVDRGELLYQKPITIERNETAYTLWHKCASEVILFFGKVYEMIINNDFSLSKIQGKGSYYPRELPFNGIINDKWSEDFIERFIRAMHFPPFIGAKYLLNEKYVEVNNFHEFKSKKFNQ